MWTVTVATRKLSHFEIEEEVGSGGAGLVYRAQDVHLGRRVALKLLRCGDAESRRRFLAEARAASSLDHPNICTIFEAGESDEGEMFIAMAWYDGETLDRILARGPLPPRKAASLAIQVARGLAAAHEELLIHRDIKPANLMLAQGETVKILDFGLARLLSAPGSRTVDGTPAYMSPEQFRGDHVDQRTDLWSLGVVLYEMVAGTPPFRGKSMAEITRAILSDSPPPLPVFADIFARALAKDPRFRYDRAEALITDLQGAIAEMDSGTVTLRRVPVTAKASLAVLPFVDMSPEQNQQYLCDGIAEEILRALNRIPDLHVASRTSAFQFRHGDVREIGARLGVEAVLEGSVRRAGDRVRVSAQLVDVVDGYRRWYERFDRDMKDIFAIEDEIAEQIAGALEVTLLHREVPPVANTEAYELYLQGMQFFHQHRSKGFEIAIQTFGRALELDPGDARSHAGIANCHSFLCLYFGRRESAGDADSASLRAVTLAPDLPEARAARGLALFVAGRLEEAETELERALALDPRSYYAHYICGRIDFSLGRIAEAAAHFRQACASVPEAYDSWYLLGMCHLRLREDNRAHEADLECMEAVKRRLRVNPDDTRAWTMGAAVLAKLGEPDRARDWVGRALAIDADEPIIRYNAACVYTVLDDRDGAIACLEALVRQGGPSRSWIANDPDLDPLRSDPRFVALIARMGV